MSNMMEMFVSQEFERQIKENYPHMQFPVCIYAKVVSVKQVSEQYHCVLKILDKNKQIDNRFPEVPNVITDIMVTAGEIVIINLLYGECIPYIIGRYY